MTETTDNVRDFLARIPNPLVLENVEDVLAKVQFEVEGNDGGSWYAEVKDNQAKISEGITTNPELVIKANSEDVISLIRGELDPFKAFMSGKVKVNGNVMLCLRLLKAVKLA